MAPCRVTVSLTLGLVTLALPAQAQDDAYTLEWKWKPGESVWYKLAQDQKQVMSGMPGMEGEMETTFNSEFLWEQLPLGVDENGLAFVQSRYESVKVSMNAPFFGDIEYDSSRANDPEVEENPMVMVFKAMTEDPFFFEMTPTGEVTRVLGFDEIADKLDAKFAEAFDDPSEFEVLRSEAEEAKAEVEENEEDNSDMGMRAFMGNDAIRQQLQMATRVLPDHPVSPGDKWNVTLSFPIPGIGGLTYEGEFQFIGIEHFGGEDCARISAVTSFQTEEEDETDDAEKTEGELQAEAAMPFDMDMKVSDSRGTGDLYFGLESGQILYSAMDMYQVFDIKMTPKAGNEQQMPEMNMKQEQTMKVILERVAHTER